MDLFTRSTNNPILKPIKNHKWESFKVYNPGAIYEEGKYHLFYRAMGKGENWHSSIGYAVSDDGEHVERFSSPLLTPDPKKDLEKRGYEDPRITKVGDTYFMTYAVYDGIEPRLNIATSKDLKSWVKHRQAFSDFHFIQMGGVFPNWKTGKLTENRNPKGKDERSKAGGIFPEKISGKYWMLFNEHRIWMAHSGNGTDWKVIPKVFLRPRHGNFFDNFFVEMGPPPIKTKKGWLVLYHGIDKKLYYRLGYLLLDLKDPIKIIYRSKKPIFGPSEFYEMSGIVDILPGGLKALQKMNKVKLKKFLEKADKTGRMPKVTFCCGATLVGDTLRIYYGASDTFICTATASLEDILDQ